MPHAPQNLQLRKLRQRVSVLASAGFKTTDKERLKVEHAREQPEIDTFRTSSSRRGPPGAAPAELPQNHVQFSAAQMTRQGSTGGHKHSSRTYPGSHRSAVCCVLSSVLQAILETTEYRFDRGPLVKHRDNCTCMPATCRGSMPARARWRVDARRGVFRCCTP